MKLNLKNFYGTEQYYFNPFFKNIKYTDGIKFIGDNKASWLITDALSVLNYDEKVLKEYTENGFISVKWIFNNDENGTATATYTDGNDEILFKQDYGITDFLKHFDINKNELTLFYTNGVLMLSGEY